MGNCNPNAIQKLGNLRQEMRKTTFAIVTIGDINWIKIKDI